MGQKTGNQSVNGTVLLSTVLQALGYKGSNNLSFCTIQNTNATPLYIIFDNQNVVPPSAPTTDGVSFGNAEETKSFNYHSAHPEQFLDAGTTWLHTTAATTIKFAVIGGGA